MSERHPEVEAADQLLKELVRKSKMYLRGFAVRRPRATEIDQAKRQYEGLKFRHHPNYPILD